MSEESLSIASSIPHADIPHGHGEAALLLVESLIHGLVSVDVMTVRDAIEVVDIAVDAHVEAAPEAGQDAFARVGTVALLEAISASLQHDLPDDG